MSIDNIQATKFFDEIRAYFAAQTTTQQSIMIIIKSETRSDGAIWIGVIDGNNQKAIPLVLMVNALGTGRRWSNEVSPNSTLFQIVSAALSTFEAKKKEWNKQNIALQANEATNFLVDFMKQVSTYLR